MQNDILLHPSTALNVLKLAPAKNHALALVGPFGAGKVYLAQQIARTLLQVTNPTSAQIHVVSPDNDSIGIDQIREVQRFLRLKSVGSLTIRRVIILENAHTMTVEAQNALLKLLEEPPEDVKLILTVVGDHSLLPTIYSRLQILHVLPVPEEQYEQALIHKYPKAQIKKAFAVSGGYAGLCLALLSDEEHELTGAIVYAKKLLGQSQYDNLLEVDGLSKDKIRARTTLFALKRILTTALDQSGAHANKRQTQKLLMSLRTVHEAEASLQQNPNMKLLLTNVMLIL